MAIVWKSGLQYKVETLLEFLLCKITIWEEKEMKEQKESFVFYRGFREAINALPQEYQLKTLQYLMDYAFDGIEPEENGVEKALFLSFKPQIDAAQKRYEANIKNGKKGGEAKSENQKLKEQKSQEKQNSSEKKQECSEDVANSSEIIANPSKDVAKTYLNDNINDNDNININDNDNTPKGEVQKGGNIPPNPLGDSLQKQLKTIRDSFVFTEALHNKVNDWLDYKKEKRQPYKPKGLQSLLSQIQNQCVKHGEQAVIYVIDTSMANNYEGILWAKIAEGKKGQAYATGYGDYGTVPETKQKPQKYGDIL